MMCDVGVILLGPLFSNDTPFGTAGKNLELENQPVTSGSFLRPAGGSKILVRHGKTLVPVGSRDWLESGTSFLERVG